MRIIFVGDVVGSSGRAVVQKYLKDIKTSEQADLVIVNGENSAHGKGITHKIYQQLLSYGADCITMGNHTFSKDAILSFIDDEKNGNMVRPINMEPHDVGHKYWLKQIGDKLVCVVNILGEVFMSNSDGSPFDGMNEILEKIKADIYIVDLHAEATSEKLAFANYYCDSVAMVVGTHTHVQTADEKIIGGCAFISDVGMCGAYDSIIGRDVQEVLTRFTTNEKTRFTVADGAGIFCAVVVDIDDNSGKATNIKRIQIRP